MITYPPWYEGGCRDVERELKNLFDRLLRDYNTADDYSIVSWIPPDYVSRLNAGVVYLRIYRLGGPLNIESRNWVDQARVQFAALAPSRDDSWDLIIFVREMLYGGFYHGARVIHDEPSLPTTFIQTPGEVVGPQLLPEPMRDERLVAVTFDIHVDRPRGLPDYRDDILEQLRGNGS